MAIVGNCPRISSRRNTSLGNHRTWEPGWQLSWGSTARFVVFRGGEFDFCALERESDQAPNCGRQRIREDSLRLGLLF
ncbi:MAG: hypothetical protein WCK86_15245 [Planctomycetia bacterium]